VLCAVDDTEVARAAAWVAADVAARLGGTLTLVHATAAGDRSQSEDLLRVLATELGPTGADGVLADGAAADVVLGVARRIAADLIVLGSRGHGAVGRIVRGSTVAGVLGDAPAPVLVVPAGAAGLRRPPRLVLAVESPGGGARMVRAIAPLALGLGARLTLLHVRALDVPGAVTMVGAVPMTLARGAEPDAAPIGPEGPDLLRGLADLGVDAHAVHREGATAQELLRLAADEDADAVVVAHRDQGTVADLVLGSPSADAIGSAQRPVLVVPPG
jgi:nucleotide-binding universal stress UspA family protein